MYISVRVVAGAKVEKVEELPKGRLKIWVKEPATQNLANRRAVELVAAHHKLPVAKVRIIAGHHTPSKLFLLDV